MLKPIFLSAFIFLGMATAASAAPLLPITKNSGFVPPRLAYRVECSVGPSSTLRRIRMGQSGRTVLRSGPTRYTPAVPDSRRALALIAAAARGRIMESSGPTDMPTSSYYSFFPLGARRFSWTRATASSGT